MQQRGSTEQAPSCSRPAPIQRLYARQPRGHDQRQHQHRPHRRGTSLIVGAPSLAAALRLFVRIRIAHARISIVPHAHRHQACRRDGRRASARHPQGACAKTANLPHARQTDRHTHHPTAGLSGTREGCPATTGPPWRPPSLSRPDTEHRKPFVGRTQPHSSHCGTPEPRRPSRRRRPRRHRHRRGTVRALPTVPVPALGRAAVFESSLP